ncbi:hypothetical protein HMPREF9057_02889 [Actinomyces sp. oral taxon 171 str. F0337]|nr:hypothetical protein HMPREF9057_02889 [Actinomyces sp. oral taxon 171 str. F0337]
MLTPDSFNGRRRCRSRHSRYRMATGHRTPNPPPVSRAIRPPQIADSAPQTSTNKESSLRASRFLDTEPATPFTFHTASDSSSHGPRTAPEPQPPLGRS